MSVSNCLRTSVFGVLLFWFSEPPVARAVEPPREQGQGRPPQADARLGLDPLSATWAARLATAIGRGEGQGWLFVGPRAPLMIAPLLKGSGRTP